MTFLELYGEALDQELGSSDRTERFTLNRRKRAINNAQMEFVRLTDCLPVTAQLDLSSTISEYDLETVINDNSFFRFTDEQPWVQMTEATGAVTTLTGPEFPRVDITLRDREDPGWRRSSPSQPAGWYLREDGGRRYFGVSPPPLIPAGSSWLVFIPYSAYPATMTADGDIPFALLQPAGNPKLSLSGYHQALAHRAAADLEKLRRNHPQVREQLGLFMAYVNDYMSKRQPTGGTRISLVHDYFRAAQQGRGPERRDIRIDP